MRIVVGVLRGGPSGYDDSLKTGASIIGALGKDKYEVRDLFVDRTGQWHMRGVPAEPERALRGVDVALNALHGTYGEDGTLQRMLEGLGVRYSGSSAYASATAFSKPAMRQAAVVAGIKVPHGTVIDSEKITDLEATARNIFRSLPQPSVVRPAVGNGGAMLADSYHTLLAALEHALVHGKVLIEEFIPGRAAAVGVVQDFREQPLYALIPQPNIFTHEEKDLLTNAAKQAHQGLGLGHYSQVRLRLGRRGVYLTGAYTQPHMHEGSTMHGQLLEVGAPLPQFVDHIVHLARRGQIN